MPEPITMIGGLLFKKIVLQGGISGCAHLLKSLSKSEGFVNAMEVIAQEFGTGALRDLFENFPELIGAAAQAIEDAEWLDWLADLLP